MAAQLEYQSLDAIMASFEGFGKSGTLATVNNNPGNLIAGSYATSQGAVGSNKGFAVFPDTSTGFSAMDALIDQYANKGLSLTDLLNKWSPPNAPGNTPESTQNYINFVSKGVGATPDTPVSQLGTPPATPGSNVFQDILDTYLGVAKGAANAAAPLVTGPLGMLPSLPSAGRIAAFALGLICVAGAVYLFKPDYVNNIGASVVEGAKAVSMAAV